MEIGEILFHRNNPNIAVKIADTPYSILNTFITPYLVYTMHKDAGIWVEDSDFVKPIMKERLEKNYLKVN